MSADGDWLGYAAEIKAAAEEWISTSGSGVTLDSSTSFVDNFELYDYLIIDGVKTMDDHGLDDFINNEMPLVEKLYSGKLGMDAKEYTENKPMIVCHGHQFDFWNCDENAILGKLISNSVAVPADKLTDPLLDLKGIAFSGSALMDFRSIIANVPVINNWLAESSALHMAHDIKHQKDTDRVPINDVFFQETVAILIANLFMNLDQKRNVRDSRFQRDPSIPEPNDDKKEKDSKFLGVELDKKMVLSKFEKNNHLCLGHTHYPQSQPYLTIPSQLIGPILKRIIERAHQELQNILPGFNFFTEGGDIRLPIKSNYFNTGVSSWHKGVVWGLEIAGEGETDDWRETVGQAKSVYFTKNSLGAEYMDWELEVMDPAVRAALDELINSNNADELLENITASAERWLGDRFNDVMRQLSSESSLSAPLSAFLLLDRGTSLGDNFSNIVPELGLGSNQEIRERAAGELDSLFGELIRLVATISQRAAGIATGGEDNFSFSVPLGDAEGSMKSILDWSENLLSDLDEASRFATLCFHALNNLPVLGRDPIIMTDGLRSFQGKAPLLSAFMALVTLLPTGEDQVLMNGVKLTTKMKIDSGKATLTVTVSGGAL